MGGQHTLAVLPLGQTWYHLYRRMGGPHGRPGLVWNISPPPGFDPQTVRPIASCYTNNVIQKINKNSKNLNLISKEF